MALVCPHLSGLTGDATTQIIFEFIDCIEDRCQIWDVDHSQCGMLVSEHVGTQPDEARGTVMEIMEHIHNKHLHQTSHDCGSDAYFESAPGIGCGSDIDDKEPPPAALALVTEFVSNEDRDKNGLVYGKDFKILNADADKPTMLKSLEESPDFTATIEYTWAGYLASLP